MSSASTIPLYSTDGSVEQIPLSVNLQQDNHQDMSLSFQGGAVLTFTNDGTLVVKLDNSEVLTVGRRSIIVDKDIELSFEALREFVVIFREKFGSNMTNLIEMLKMPVEGPAEIAERRLVAIE